MPRRQNEPNSDVSSLRWCFAKRTQNGLRVRRGVLRNEPDFTLARSRCLAEKTNPKSDSHPAMVFCETNPIFISARRNALSKNELKTDVRLRDDVLRNEPNTTLRESDRRLAAPIERASFREDDWDCPATLFVSDQIQNPSEAYGKCRFPLTLRARTAPDAEIQRARTPLESGSGPSRDALGSYGVPCPDRKSRV